MLAVSLCEKKAWTFRWVWELWIIVWWFEGLNKICKKHVGSVFFKVCVHRVSTGCQTPSSLTLARLKDKVLSLKQVCSWTKWLQMFLRWAIPIPVHFPVDFFSLVISFRNVWPVFCEKKKLKQEHLKSSAHQSRGPLAQCSSSKWSAITVERKAYAWCRAAPARIQRV